MSEYTDLPATAQSVVLKETGGSEQLQIVSGPVPDVKDGQVLIQNRFAGVNYMDIYLRTGHYPSPVGYPLVLGLEGAGTIVKVAGNNRFKFQPGERVVWLASAGYAEYTCVDQDRVVRIPEEVSDEDAVASHLTGMTALTLIEEAYPPKQGDVVLVHAAAGAVGLILCQLLTAEGITVIATAGGADKCALVKEFGAAHAIDYRETSGESWLQQVKALTGGRGVDAVRKPGLDICGTTANGDLQVYDSVGKDTWRDSIAAAKVKGTVVYFGTASKLHPCAVTKISHSNNMFARWAYSAAGFGPHQGQESQGNPAHTAKLCSNHRGLPVLRPESTPKGAGWKLEDPDT